MKKLMPRKQDGGKVANNKRYFIQNWLLSRTKQLGKNTEDSRSKISDYWTSHDKIGKETLDRQMRNLDTLQEYSFDNTFTPLEEGTPIVDLLKRDYKNTITDSKSEPTIDDLNKFKYIRKGLYSPRLHSAVYYSNDDDTTIHERTHSLNANPQEKAIREYSKQTPYGVPLYSKYKGIFREGTKRDSYLDSSTEIYSRLMEFRFMNRINPRKTYSIEDIRKLREDKNTKDYDLLNRYNDEYLYNLLNDVADNGSANMIPSAKSGKKLIPRKK